MRKHTGDKPFKCVVEGCDKAYTTKANLRLHQKRHEGKALSQDDSMEEKEDRVVEGNYANIFFEMFLQLNSVDTIQ